jgi:hypothetical protein
LDGLHQGKFSFSYVVKKKQINSHKYRLFTLYFLL